MEVRDQLHAPAALRFEKEAPEPLEYDAGWIPETVNVLEKRSIFPSLAMVRHAARLTSGGSLRKYTQRVHPSCYAIIVWWNNKTLRLCVFLTASVFWYNLSNSGENLGVWTSSSKPCVLVNVNNVWEKSVCFVSTVQITPFNIPVRVTDRWYPWRNHD